MNKGRSFTFNHAITRKPSESIASGLRATDLGDPDPVAFLREHEGYVAALRATGAKVIVLEPLEAFPDSVFVEDTALCLAGHAIVLRPGAPTRLGEAEAMRPTLVDVFGEVLDLPGDGFVEGGDVLVTDSKVFAGLSARTNVAGVEALEEVVTKLGYTLRMVNTPPEILHFKTECSLLDGETIFATRRLAHTGCFDGYCVIEVPDGEEAAANAIRFNDTVFISEGFPQTHALLEDHGYKVVEIACYEAAKLDGGLSCMSLRFSV